MLRNLSTRSFLPPSHGGFGFVGILFIYLFNLRLTLIIVNVQLMFVKNLLIFIGDNLLISRLNLILRGELTSEYCQGLLMTFHTDTKSLIYANNPQYLDRLPFIDKRGLQIKSKLMKK
jgi:hypothetical protein